MAADDFHWPLAEPSSGKVDFRVRSAQFGDGYAQVVADGLNNKVQTWSVSINNVTESYLQPITDFLDSKAGYVSFTWTPPRATQQIRVRCTSYTRSPVQGKTGIVSLSATFQQAFSF